MASGKRKHEARPNPVQLPVEIRNEIIEFRNLDRTRATIHFRLTDFPAFACGTDDRISAPIIICGMKWHLIANPWNTDNGQRYLCMMLKCSPPTRYEKSYWAIEANATCHIHQADDLSVKFHSATMATTQFTSSRPIEYAFPHFVEMHRIWNAENKLLSVDNSIELSCDIETTSAVHGSKKETTLCIEGIRGIAGSALGFKRSCPSFQFDGFNWALQVERSAC